jgi:cytochrome P450
VDALYQVRDEFINASVARRQAVVDSVRSGHSDASALERDVVTTLLWASEELALSPEEFLREIAYFPWVGSHSTSHQLVHAMHHLFTWIAEHPEDREPLTHDSVLRQKFVHESLRLHPASPVALRQATEAVILKSGMQVASGELVSLDMEAANRDPQIFGPDAHEFDPHRELPTDVAPWGLSFGHGIHACLGQELAAGVPLHQMGGLEHHLLGAVAVMSGVLLASGARPDSDDPAVIDTSTTRTVFSRYPVVLDQIP